MCVTRLIHTCDMTHLNVYVRHVLGTHDSCLCVTWLIDGWDMTHPFVGHDSSTCVLWLIHMCDTAQSFSWRDSFICVTWLSDMSDMTHSCVWHDSFMCVTWLICVCDMTFSYVYFRDSFGPNRMTKVYMRINRIPHTEMSHVTHLNESCHTHKWVMSHSFARCCLTHLHVRRDVIICVTWHIHVCCMPNACVWCDAFMCMMCRIHVCDITLSCVPCVSFMCVMWRIHVCDITHHIESRDPFMWVPSLMRWLWFVGLLKIIALYCRI